MNRREFLRETMLVTGATMTPALCVAATKTARSRIRWTRSGELFAAVACDGQPMCPMRGLLTANCRVAGESTTDGPGPLRISVEHRLHDSGAGMGEMAGSNTPASPASLQKSRRGCWPTSRHCSNECPDFVCGISEAAFLADGPRCVDPEKLQSVATGETVASEGKC